jgi:hypothetical protein
MSLSQAMLQLHRRPIEEWALQCRSHTSSLGKAIFPVLSIKARCYDCTAYRIHVIPFFHQAQQTVESRLLLGCLRTSFAGRRMVMNCVAA